MTSLVWAPMSICQALALARSRRSYFKQRHRNDPVGILARAVTAAYQGKFHEGRAILAPMVSAGAATPSLLNEYAWLSVAAHEVDDSAVRASRKAAGEFSGREPRPFRANHTLACMLALSGQPKEALDVLVKARNAAGMTAPNSSTWFAQGLIAEAYGDTRSARPLYGRADVGDEDPASAYNLARRRLERLELGSGPGLGSAAAGSGAPSPNGK